MKNKALLAAISLVILASAVAAGEITKGPYLQDLTPNGVTIMWETDKPAATAVVRFGPTAALGRSEKPDGLDTLRKVRLEGLSPGQTYYYAVDEKDALSSTCSFATLPESGPFTFVAYGDTRTNPTDHFRVATMIAARRPAFVLHSGDLVADGRQADHWDEQFFGPAAGLLARFNVFPAIGNHERESALYYKYFPASTGAAWYSFDCANAHFIMLNSCVDTKPGSKQHDWLLGDLKANTKRWTFVTFHHPPYSSGRHGSSVRLRNILAPLFTEYGVDMVFNGHDHHYERTFPIASAFRKVHPVTYVVTGGGGAPRRPVSGDFFTAARKSDLNYCLVKIDSDTLYFKAFDGDNQRIDSFAIVKSDDGYAGDYPDAVAVPVELTDAQGSIQLALMRERLEYPETARQEKLDLEFTAPGWSPLELELEWTPLEDAATVEPATAAAAIPAGEILVLSFTVDVPAGKTASRRLTVKAKTSLGEFQVQTNPVRFQRRPREK